MAKVNAKPAAPLAAGKILLVFGFDENDKPRAARFDAGKAELVHKAAAAMDLKVIETTADDYQAIAKKLPEGKLYANGKGFVPHIRSELYLKVTEALGSAAQAPNVEQKYPKHWDEIGAGDLVLAQASLVDGWWEAVVTGREERLLKLRWRDYPKYEPFTRNIAAVALICPP
jgi:hypothetical protein